MTPARTQSATVAPIHVFVDDTTTVTVHGDTEYPSIRIGETVVLLVPDTPESTRTPYDRLWVLIRLAADITAALGAALDVEKTLHPALVTAHTDLTNGVTEEWPES